MPISVAPLESPRTARGLTSLVGLARRLTSRVPVSASIPARPHVARPRHGIAAVAVGLAVAAAVSVALIARRTREAERQNPPAGRFLNVDGVRLHYVDRGAGRPLVLLHGNGSMIDELESSGIVGLAARKYRVIAFDRPGFGYSERPRRRVWGPRAQADLLWRALARLGVDQPIVLGHSWGTLVALRLALEHPEGVRGLVLASGYYFPSPRLDVPLLSAPAIPVLGDLLRWTLSPWVGRLAWQLILRRIFGPAPVPVRFAALPVWMMLRPGQLRAAAAESAMMIPASISLRSRYRELAMPVLVLAGEQDRHVKCEQSRRLANELSRGELWITPGAGHMLHHFAPEELVAAVDAVAGASVRLRGGRLAEDEDRTRASSAVAVSEGTSSPRSA